MMDKNTIAALQKHLFAELEELRDKNKQPDLERSKAVVAVSGQIIATGRLEVDYLRITESRQESKFLSGESLETSADAAKVTAIGVQVPTHSGNKSIEQRPGGTIITHRMR